MPAKGKYLLNDQEMVRNEALYRKYSWTSQYQLLVLLLGLSMLFCVFLLILFFALRLVSFNIHICLKVILTANTGMPAFKHYTFKYESQSVIFNDTVIIFMTSEAEERSHWK